MLKPKPDGFIYIAVILAFVVAAISTTRTRDMFDNSGRIFIPGNSFEITAMEMTDVNRTQVAVGP